jgi:hypothetical protein
MKKERSCWCEDDRDGSFIAPAAPVAAPISVLIALITPVYTISEIAAKIIPTAKKMTGASLSFRADGKLLAQVASQGKVRPLITEGGLKSDSHNFSVGLKSGPVGSAVQIAK